VVLLRPVATRQCDEERLPGCGHVRQRDRDVGEFVSCPPTVNRIGEPEDRHAQVPDRPPAPALGATQPGTFLQGNGGRLRVAGANRTPHGAPHPARGVFRDDGLSDGGQPGDRSIPRVQRLRLTVQEKRALVPAHLPGDASAVERDLGTVRGDRTGKHDRQLRLGEALRGFQLEGVGHEQPRERATALSTGPFLGERKEAPEDRALGPRGSVSSSRAARVARKG
jgi:hypothetical protein